MSLSDFAPLDGIVQLIRTGSNSFVLVSTLSASEDCWTVDVGLDGQGRWWSASWTLDEALEYIGVTKAGQSLFALASTIKQAIIVAEVSVLDWESSDMQNFVKQSSLVIPFGSSSLKLPLAPLPAHEATTRMISLFSHIAIRAQKNENYLYRHQREPSANQSLSSKWDSQNEQSVPCKTKRTRREETVDALKIKAQEEEIEDLRAKLAETKNLSNENTITQVNPRYVNTVPARKPAKGASLANPNKRMRTLTALEFED